MKYLDEIKIGGFLATFTGVTLAQVNTIVQIAVGLATLVYIILKIIKLKRRKGTNGSH